jgi:hypothetical protein
MSGKFQESDDDGDLHSWYHADALGDKSAYESIFAKGLKDKEVGFGTCSADPDFDQEAYEDGFKSKHKKAASSGAGSTPSGPVPGETFYKEPPYQPPAIGVDTGGMSLEQKAKQDYDDDPRTPIDKDNDPKYGTTTTDGVGGPDEVTPELKFGTKSPGQIDPKTGNLILFSDLF